VLLRLAYLGVTNPFAMLRLLPMSDRDKDTEILALRHRITVLQRQLGDQKVRLQPSDRTLLAALLHRLPLQALRGMKLLVRPDTVLRWHRNLLARRHAIVSRPKRLGRPRTLRSIRILVLRLARENPCWGYRRVHGELLVVGVKVAPFTVWEILNEAGIDPAPPLRKHLGRLPALTGQCAAGVRLHGNAHPDRGTNVRPRGDRARHPPSADPGRHRAPDRLVGDPGGAQPRHGPAGRRLPGQVSDP
jgi:hypothetical protein